MRHARGFTLLELIIVIAIIGVLSVIIIPSFRTALSRANDTKLKQFALQLDKKNDITNRYDFEEGSGLSAKDTSVNFTSGALHNNLTIPGSGVTYSSNTYSSSSQYSLLFDGTNPIIAQANTPPSLDNKSFSISLWFKRTGFGVQGTFLYKLGAISTDNWITAGFLPDNRLYTDFYADGLFVPGITDSNWHHFVMSFDVSTKVLVMYLDGAKVGSKVMINPLSLTDNNPIKIGSGFVGNIDDFRVYEGQVIVR